MPIEQVLTLPLYFFAGENSDVGVCVTGGEFSLSWSWCTSAEQGMLLPSLTKQGEGIAMALLPGGGHVRGVITLQQMMACWCDWHTV